MARCTAPTRGHRTASAAADCPVCGNRYSRYSGHVSYSAPTYTQPSSGGNSGGRSSSGSKRAPWSRSGSSLLYTATQVQSLTPVREAVEARAAQQPDLRDVFLCHAWDDRQGVAKELRDLLVAAGVKVWFSENDLPLGSTMMRAIDKGLANSRIGLVLVTPALLASISREGVADKELAVLLMRNLLVPIVHNTTYSELLNVSPMLASRSGLDTTEDSMSVVAEKIAELVTLYC
jgi:hypothetical protein